jgi:transcriptional regulator with XRE-family HTH domain
VPPDGFEVPPFVFKLLNKLPVSELAQLSNLSKAYISQVKHGKRPPSQKLVQTILDFQKNRGRQYEPEPYDVLRLFLRSRREGLSPRTLEFYEGYLKKSVGHLGLAPSARALNAFLSSLTCSEGGKHAYYRALRTFFRWLYSPRSGLGLKMTKGIR